MTTTGAHATLEQEDCNRWYLSGIAGVNYMNSSTEVGPQLGFALGYRLSPSFRLEGETVTRVNKFKYKPALFGTSTLSANIFYDLNLHSHVKPYFGLGVGSQHRLLTYESYGTLHRVEGDAVAYQGVFGTNVQLTISMIASFEYRYIANNKESDTSQSLGFTVKRLF